MSTSDAKLNAYLILITSEVNFYFGIFIFFFGIIGNILNILILSQRTLRTNTCVMILLASSITGTITILSGLTPRVSSKRNADISEYIQSICKIHGFLLYVFRFITFWLFTLATIDRWLVSSRKVYFRHLSSPKNVRRSIILLTFLSLILHSQIFHCYESNLLGTPLKCFNKDGLCRLMNDLMFAILTILCPVILIVIFGLMTISNIRQSRGRIVAVVNNQQPGQRLHRTDQYLFMTLLIQVIVFACLTLPLAIEKLYATLSMNMHKSSLQLTIEDLSYEIFLLMTFLAPGMQFYINTLAGGEAFRKARLDLQKTIARKLFCR